MHNLIRRLAGHRSARQPISEANRSHSVRPCQIRDRCFNVRWRGLDPVETRAFLHQVADELTVAQTALVVVKEENVRTKNALRSWQSTRSANHRYR